MDIFLSINNREQVIRLPVNPSEITINDPQNNETFETVNGSVQRIGKPGLITLTLSSFFPKNNYSFAKIDKTPLEYIKMLREWKNRRIPIRIVIAELDFNKAMAINNFVTKADTSNDLSYTLELSEFRFANFTTGMDALLNNSTIEII